MGLAAVAGIASSAHTAPYTEPFDSTGSLVTMEQRRDVGNDAFKNRVRVDHRDDYINRENMRELLDADGGGHRSSKVVAPPADAQFLFLLDSLHFIGDAVSCNPDPSAPQHADRGASMDFHR
ncbi:hypothetical protein BPY_18760 [Bifidobacterium psychraerophilum]